MNTLLFFGGLNPMEWVIILAIALLLFGGTKLPQLAKALGQSKRAFREGMDEADEEARLHPKPGAERPSLAAIDDEALFEEARRRAADRRAAEASVANERLLSDKDAAAKG